MNVSDKKLLSLGRYVVKGAPPSPYPDCVETQRLEFANQFHKSEKLFSPKQFVFTTVGVAAAAAVIATVVIFLSAPDHIPFRIGPSGTPGTEGSWVEASPQKETPIRFSGGTKYVLKKGGSARIIESNTEQVVVDLSKGELHCSVNGNGKTKWVVRAGVHRVTVTGTEFTVQWDAATSNLNVNVIKGSVLVSGKTLTAHGVTLSKGDSLNVIADKITIARNANTSSPPPENLDATDGKNTGPNNAHEDNMMQPAAAHSVVKGSKSKRENSRLAQQQKSKSLVPQWKMRCNEKDFAGAVSAARSIGLDRLANELNANDLWQLAESGRYAKDGAAAQKLLLAITTRFPGTRKAQNATFLLGRVSEELFNNPTGAKRWYEKYLSLGPSNALSEESLGRLIGVCRKTGNHEKAKEYAKYYLSKYPKGSFAANAHSVLE